MIIIVLSKNSLNKFLPRDISPRQDSIMEPELKSNNLQQRRGKKGPYDYYRS